MSRYGSKDLKIEFDSTEGGSLADMSNYITSINGVSIEAILEEGTAFGDTWLEQLFTGNKQMADITLGGFYDDTATTGPNAVFVGIGETRSLKVTWGSTKTTAVETIIKSYARNPAVKTLTKFQVVLSPTGTVTEA